MSGVTYSNPQRIFDSEASLNLEKCISGQYQQDGKTVLCKKLQCVRMNPLDLNKQPYVSSSNRDLFESANQPEVVPCDQVLTSSQQAEVQRFVDQGLMSTSDGGSSYDFVQGAVRIES